MNHIDQEIINAIKLLQHVKPDDDFRNRMERKIHSFSPTGRFAMPFFALRVALVVFLVLLGGTGMVSASADSQPGQILYPVKQLVNSVKTSFTADKYISTAPVAPEQEVQEQAPVATPTLDLMTPTPTFVPQQQTLPASDVRQPTLQPTVTLTLTPTPQPRGGVGAAVDNAVNIQLGNAPQPTPTPQPTSEGSKDNGSNAGAGGSLLPKIKIGH